jgi:hypothetical protein
LSHLFKKERKKERKKESVGSHKKKGGEKHAL